MSPVADEQEQFEELPEDLPKEGGGISPPRKSSAEESPKLDKELPTQAKTPEQVEIKAEDSGKAGDQSPQVEASQVR